MGFTEVTFLFVCMPVSIIIYLFFDKVLHNTNFKNFILVALSFIFYLWANKEATLFLFVIGFYLYFAGEMLDKMNQDCENKGKIKIPIIFLLGVLVFYKYISLIVEYINTFANTNLLNAGSFIAPVGLSFIIFESISYLVDIYRGDAKAGTLLECFTFISLFPKIVSGPIVLWKDFKPFLQDRRSTGDNITAGIDRIIVGFAKKAIIADTFGAQISLINTEIAGTGVDVPTMWLRALLYFFQLYFDFSGYSDIALGLCSIFGFTIKENFNYPYLSLSISEFWRRWHISLGSWFREYVYIPLGGNRRGNVYVHLLIVFILTGLWHGTGLQYLAWGLVHGLLILLERRLSNTIFYKRIPSLVKWLFTIIFVFFTWILFMSKDLTTALSTYQSMVVPMTTATVNFTWRYYLSNRILLFLVIAIAGHLFGVEKLKNKILLLLETDTGTVLKRVALLLLFVIDILYVVNSTYSPFIYFQF